MLVKKFNQFIKESLGITVDTILSSIDAKELNINDILKGISNTDLDKLEKDNKFIELLKRSKLKKSNIESTNDYETFSLIPFKFMFLYDIKSTELDTPYYILIQVYNQALNAYENTRCYKINSNINNFYNQLSSKIICVQDGNENFIYDTSNANEWTLTSLRIDTAYFDEAHILATNSQKEDAKFKENYEQVVSKNYFFFSATPKDLLGLREGENTDSFLMNNKSIFGERVGITFATAVAKAYIVEPVIHLLRPSDYVDGMEDFGSIADKVKFIQESFYAHRDYMRSKSADPSKLGVKILVKCSSVTEEMWPIFNLLKGSMPGVKICAGASVENTDGTYSQGKHCIDEHTINRRDDYLYSLQKLKPEEEAIILHFDILSEGINVAGFTGIMFLSGLMLTITKILQNIGRATRLHKLDRDRLRDKLISVSDYSKWIKPCCAVIIPYWNNTSEQTKRQMETIIHDLRYRYDFTARLELTLGDDRGISAGDPEIPENLLNEERERIRQALVDDIEQEIEGIRVGIYERYESNRIDNLSDEDWYNEVLSSL